MFGQPPHRHERNLCDRQKVDPAVSLRGEGPEVRNDRHYRYGVKSGVTGPVLFAAREAGIVQVFRTPARRALHALMGPASEKAPRHEIAVGRAPGGASSAMGIWAGRGAVRFDGSGLDDRFRSKNCGIDFETRACACASGIGVGPAGRCGATMQAGARLGVAPSSVTSPASRGFFCPRCGTGTNRA